MEYIKTIFFAVSIKHKILDTLKNITFCENTVTLKSALDETSSAKLEELAVEIAKDFGK